MNYIFRLHLPGKFIWETHDTALTQSLDTLNLKNGDNLLCNCFDPSSKRKRILLRLHLQNKEVILYCPSDQTPDETIYNFYICGSLAKRNLNLSGVLTNDNGLTPEELASISCRIREFLKDRGFC